MSLVSRILGRSNGQRRKPDFRARLSVNGIEYLEQRIQPAKATLASHGIGAEVREIAQHIGIDHTVPPGSIVSAAVHALKAGLGGGSGGGGGGSVANASVSGTAFIDWNGNGLLDPGENADSGLLVTLSGTDTLGNPVASQSMGTGDNGQYLFTGLSAGTYTVTFSPTFEQGTATLGSAGGAVSVDTTTIDGIALTGTTTATDYNFAITPAGS